MTRLWNQFREWWLGTAEAGGLRIFERCLALVTLLSTGPFLWHGGEWLADSGFQISARDRSPASPPWLPPLPMPLVPLVAFAFIACCLVSFRREGERWAAFGLALLLAYFGHLDPNPTDAWRSLLVIGWLVIATGPAPWTPTDSPRIQVVTPVRILQLTIILYYLGAGVAKVAYGHWLGDWNCLWSHAHGPDRTVLGAWMVRNLPTGIWSLLQAMIIVFELAAPLWLGLPALRKAGLLLACFVHGFQFVTFVSAWQVGIVALSYLSLFLQPESLRIAWGKLNPWRIQQPETA